MFTPIIAGAGLTGYQLLQDTLEAQKETLALDPQIARDVAYFQENISSVQSGADLLRDRRLLSVALTAYGLETELDKGAFISQVLDGGVEEDTSFANRLNDRRWSDITRAFGFGNSTPSQELPAIQVALELAVNERGLLGQQSGGLDLSEDDLAYFRAEIDDITSTADFVADDRLLRIGLTLFGLENDGKSTAFIQDVLEDDITDPTAFVNQLADDSPWRQLNVAFNGITESGGVSSDILQYEVERRLIEQNPLLSDDLQYVRDNFNLIDENIDIVLDPKLQDIILSAFGLEQDTYESTFVLNMIVADPQDDNSLIYAIGDDRWIEFNSVFGTTTTSGNTGLDRFAEEVVDRFIDRSFEIAVGDLDEDMRLALNFEAQIGAIANGNGVEEAGWLTIMGDNALRQVIDKMFGLPAEFAQLDVDQQVPIYEQRALQLFGVSDPSALQNPENVETAIERFFLQRQIENGSQSGGAAALALLQNTLDSARNFTLNVVA